MRTGVYIHIPFCKSRCIYCGFYSTTSASLRSQYVEALMREMELRCGEMDALAPMGDSVVDTIYIGGGTPSVLPVDDLCAIIGKVGETYTCRPREITVEMNPDDVSGDVVSVLRDCGVNRISMGVQTFSDERLRMIHRRHTARQAVEAVAAVRRAGIDNVSIDLMFGFPGETLAQWRDDLRAAVALEPEHISAYSLMYEEGTPLYAMLQSGRVAQTDDDICLAMYTELMDVLAANGYEHYEISNFAKPGRRSLHNSSYWHDVPYLGFGASAHSYLKTRRCWNVADVAEYVRSVSDGIVPQEGERIDADTHYDDLVTTAMRTCEGLNLGVLSDRHRAFALKCARKSMADGLLELHDNHLRLTRKGLFVSDMVMSDMMMV